MRLLSIFLYLLSGVLIRVFCDINNFKPWSGVLLVAVLHLTIRAFESEQKARL